MCLAVPGQVKEIYGENGMQMGRVNFGGIVKEVCLAYLPEIAVGEYVVVHVGFAINKLDEAAAMKSIRTFKDLGLFEEEFGELGAFESS
ncbi:Hydrogenase maturation protein HypC [Bryocella elongata]|uniref:Hydrogenase maturation protein HypC n=1 Tax=Bryocella elongata TaxID=863522 RepID=A0A1H6CAN7_9BACT|nr:HypC/HybG/HupF family hydrogenase formation chaperone [Bryocella elongata]SEG70034.1 Hydrogenase maturation protein HypC [Bryocella elongata]